MGENFARNAMAAMPRWHVVHWATPGTSTLLLLWVAGRETLVPIDGNVATFRGEQHALCDGQLIQLLQSIQHEQDQAVLGDPDAVAAQEHLLERWQHGPPGTWEFPRGGFLRWTSHDGLVIEASDDGPAGRPLPEPLQAVLIDLGWNPPNVRYRNCWLQPAAGKHAAAAAVAVLTTLAAFGYKSPPPLHA